MFKNRTQKLTAVLVLAAAVTAGRALAAASPAAAKPAAKTGDLFDAVIAKGKGFEIKRAQLDEAMVNLKSSAAARGQVIPPEHIPMLEQQVLQRIIQVQVLLSNANPADKAKGKETADRRLESIKSRAGSEEVLLRQLKSVGTTLEELGRRLAEESTAEAVLERGMKVNVTDADAKKYYDDNPAKFEQPEMVRASHILVTTKDQATGQDLPDDKKAAKRKQAEELLKRARAGEDFAKLARENSDDPGSKEKGGEYVFPRGQMVPEFEAAAFSLQTNQVSDLVATQYGWHIIKLAEKIPAKKVELAKVSSDVKDFLKQEQLKSQEQAVKDYMKKLEGDAKVQILDPALKPQEPPADPAK